MASPILVPTRIAALIALGKCDDLDRLGTQDILAIIQERDELMRVHWRDWDVVTATMPLDDLVALIKALTIIERLFRWAGGSVSSVIWTFRALERRDHALSQQIAHWILERTANDYVAKEAHRGTMTVDQQLAVDKRRQAAAEAHRQSEQEQQGQAEVRRAARIAGEVERQKAKAVEAAQRNAEIAELGALPVPKRLTRIANGTHHLHYWPDEFAQATPAELDTLEEGIRAKLRERTATSNLRCWKRLSTLLQEATIQAGFVAMEELTRLNEALGLYGGE